VAGHGTPEFLRCGRLLALCGWGVQQLRPPRPVSAAAEPARGAGRPRLAHAADAAIACALCGAKAGLWQFVPRAAPSATSQACARGALPWLQLGVRGRLCRSTH